MKTYKPLKTNNKKTRRGAGVADQDGLENRERDENPEFF